MLARRLRAEDRPTADQRQHRVDLLDPLGGAGEDILREDDQVGALAGLEGAELGLLAGGVGVPAW